MKYRKILIFLIICIIVLSCALITFAFLSRDTYLTSNNIDLSQNTDDQNVYENNTIENSIIENVIDENAIDENNIQNNSIVEDNESKKTKDANNEKQENQREIASNNEEENKENEKNKQDKESIALELIKNEWGEDNTVLFTMSTSYSANVCVVALLLTLISYILFKFLSIV